MDIAAIPPPTIFCAGPTVHKEDAGERAFAFPGAFQVTGYQRAANAAEDYFLPKGLVLFLALHHPCFQGNGRVIVIEGTE